MLADQSCTDLRLVKTAVAGVKGDYGKRSSHNLLVLCVCQKLMQCFEFLKIDCAAVVLVMNPEDGRQMIVADVHVART